jgi:RNA polymerase sigma factor (sigma-70 family)
MRSRNRDQDVRLVTECLGGSEEAWVEFHCRFQPLVKSIVRKQSWILRQDLDDVTQSVFVSILSSLDKYDSAHTLSGFVEMITDRVCIDNYRSHKAAKRYAATNPVEHHDGGEEGYISLSSTGNSQEDEFSKSELQYVLRHAFRALGQRCQDLLNFRYFEEIPYKELTGILNATENTLSVKAKRCLEDLRAKFDEFARKGVGR